MKILYVSNCYPPNFIGGAELVAHRHACELLKLGCDVEVLAADHSGEHPPLHEANDVYEGIPVTRVSVSERETSWNNENFRNPHIDRIFEKVLKRLSPDVVHCHNLPGLSVNFINICHSAGVPVALTAHDHWGFCHRQTLTLPDGRLCANFEGCSDCLPTYNSLTQGSRPINDRNSFVKEAFQKLSLLISPSFYLLTKYISAGFCPPLTKVISNGIDTSKFHSSPSLFAPSNDRISFGSMCHLASHKGIGLILDSLDRLPQNSDWSYQFAGAGPMAENINNYLIHGRNSSKVTFHGRLDPKNTNVFYNNIDVFVIASLWPENQPVTILEAMASGRAVVAPAAGGCPELVLDGLTGELFRFGDSVDFTDVLCSYIRSNGKAKAHGAAGAKRVSAWSLKVAAQQLLSEYCSLLGCRA